MKITKKALKYLPQDNEYYTHLVEKVTDTGDGYNIFVDGGSMLFIPKHPTFIPTVGLTAQFYGKGFGYIVRGVVISDVPFFYRTPQESEKDHKSWYLKEERKREKILRKNIKKMDADYDALPEYFKKRIDRFRNNNYNFRRDYEGYEMFCCKEAIKIANALKTVDEIDRWKNLNYGEQKEVVDIDSGHSGNTFGCAISLAKLYLSQPENVIKAHGALTPLVGCKAYGCNH